MIGIKGIGTYVPTGRESNFDKQEKFGIDEKFIVGKLGVEKVSRKAPDEETSDLCVKAVADLEMQLGPGAAKVECLIVCTQNPDGRGLPHTSAIVHGKLGLPKDCACFDISLGCSGFVYGLSIVSAFMQANGFASGLLITADPYSKIVDPDDKNTVLLFGDGAAATLLRDGCGPGDWIPGPYRFGTLGKDGAALENNRNGKLFMNGRAVFNFSATEVPAQVKALLQQQGLTPDDIDLFLFHQGSKFIVDHLIKRLALPPEKVPMNLADQGNTVSTSLPLLLKDRLKDDNLTRLLLSAFGVGLSWASCILERAK